VCHSPQHHTSGKTEAAKQIMKYLAAVSGGGATEIDRVKQVPALHVRAGV
jgi:hypothetical protein